MASSLYHFNTNAKDTIKKFRISTSRSETVQILPIKIEPKPSYQITIDEEELEELKGVSELEGLAEVLPNNAPRYLLTAYPVTTRDNIKQVPLVLIYWKPATVVSQEWKMLYAGALEEVRTECGTYKLIEVSSGLEDDDDVEELKQQLVK
ncbi:probable protein AIM7 [Zygosaccharomyces bailii]|nr:probable protein AIM7 [Zygosaccharomyces bailii]